jgi:chromosome segregation ATPase
MQIVKQLLGTNSGPDSATLRQQQHEALVRVGQGREQQRQLQQQLEALQLQRAELLEERETEGADITQRLRAVDGKLSRVQRELADIGPQVKVRERRAADLEQQARTAEQREAPGKMLELSARHRELLADVRSGMAQAMAALREIAAIEQEGVRLQREYNAPPAKTTPLVFFAQDALQAIETLAAKMPPPFEDARRKTDAEALQDAQERDRKALETFYRYGHNGPRYDEQAVQETDGVMVINPRLVVSRELGTPFMGSDYVSEKEAAQIRKEMDAEGVRTARVNG